MFSSPSLPTNQCSWAVFLLSLPASRSLTFCEFPMKFVVIVRDRLIFCGHMPYVLKEDDKYCFVTCSWQNAKWSENKDTFHTWNFKKILGKILQTELQCAACESYWLRKKFTVTFYCFTIDSVCTDPWQQMGYIIQ